MPAIPTNSKVLVTGANGYIATWTVHNLLDKGFCVRAVVRSEDKGLLLRDQFKPYGANFEIAIVEDMCKDGAYDEAIRGIDAIIHMATPTPMGTQSDDPDDFIKPAVAGALEILKSASHSSQVKRVVLTSSTGAVYRPDDEGVIFDENDWNNAPKTIEEQGRAASMISKYCASKTLAEQAAWDFYNSNKSKLGWDLVVLNPSVVIGPGLIRASTPPATSMLWYGIIGKDGLKDPDGLKASNSYIDVRDAAEAHVRALTVEEAGGERIIISAGAITWQEAIDIMNAIDPPPALKAPPKGTSSLDKVLMTQYNGEKAKRLLGIEYRKVEETSKDLLDDLVERGL